MDNVMKKMCKTRRNEIPGGFFFLQIFLLVIFLPGLPSLSVTWLPNLEWNNVKNWADGFIPENGTRVVFPVEMRLSVGLPARNYPLDLTGLELPRDGALALPQTGILTISPAQDSAKTAHWSLEGPLLWVDPNNWNSEKSTNAVPHLERIPCQDDLVILPDSKQTFSIKLPNSPGSTVRAVKVKDDTGPLLSWEWRNLQTESQREFSSGPMSVGYAGVQSCLECTCQPPSVGRNLFTEVCQTQGARCGELECEYPLTIEGHCCYYCGGRVVLSDKTSLTLAKRVANLGLENYGSTLSWWVRKTWDSKTEILVAGKRGYSAENTIKGISSLTSVLQEQGIKFSTVETTGAEAKLSKWAAIVGPFFGTLLMAILLLLVAIPYYGYSLPQVFGESWRGFRELINTSGGGSVQVLATGGRDQPSTNILRRPFRFARFENAPESEVELETSSSGIVIAHGRVEDDDDDDDDDDEGRQGGGGRFANPLYRSGRKQLTEVNIQNFANLQRLHDNEEEVDVEIDLAIEP